MKNLQTQLQESAREKFRNKFTEELSPTGVRTVQMLEDDITPFLDAIVASTIEEVRKAVVPEEVMSICSIHREFEPTCRICSSTSKMNYGRDEILRRFTELTSEQKDI